jgi:cell division protein FtsQ
MRAFRRFFPLEKIPALREQKVRSRSNRKLIVFLFLLFFTLLAVLFFRSPISKIERIEVAGNALLSEEQIVQASGTRIGDHFFAVRSSSVASRIKAMPVVRDAKVKKRFPGVLRIEVSEYPPVAYQLKADGNVEALLANGVAVPADRFAPMDKPLLTGWSDSDPWKQKLCEALGKIPPELLADISEIRPAPTPAYEDKIKMYMRSQFEVYTTVTYLPDKMPYLPQMIAEMRKKNVNSGVFELLEVDTHVPFDLYYGGKETDPQQSRSAEQLRDPSSKAGASGSDDAGGASAATSAKKAEGETGAS